MLIVDPVYKIITFYKIQTFYKVNRKILKDVGKCITSEHVKFPCKMKMGK